MFTRALTARCIVVMQDVSVLIRERRLDEAVAAVEAILKRSTGNGILCYFVGIFSQQTNCKLFSSAELNRAHRREVFYGSS